MRRRDSQAGSRTRFTALIYAELHPPAGAPGPPTNLYPGAAHERRAACLRRLRLTHLLMASPPQLCHGSGVVEDASGDVAAVDARDVNTQLQVEMIKQQLKTNALLRDRTRTVSASLAPARTRTRPVQQ